MQQRRRKGSSCRPVDVTASVAAWLALAEADVRIEQLVLADPGVWAEMGLKVAKPGGQIQGASPKRRPGHEFGRRRGGCNSKLLAPKPASDAALRVCVRCAGGLVAASGGAGIRTKSDNRVGGAKGRGGRAGRDPRVKRVFTYNQPSP